MSAMRVLVVDESAERALKLRAALREAGCEVPAPLSSPLELREKIAQLEPDLIVMAADSPIVAAALAGFEELRALKAELAKANLKLAERKLVERAKGLLMKSRGLDEETAYAALRKMAMDRSLRLGEVAQRVLDAANLLGA